MIIKYLLLKVLYVEAYAGQKIDQEKEGGRREGGGGGGGAQLREKVLHRDELYKNGSSRKTDFQ